MSPPIPEAPGVPGMATKDERLWATLAHLGGLAGYVAPLVGNIIAPLVIWLVKKDESSFVADQAKEALNFQITISICAVILAVPSVILMFVGIGFLLLPALIVFDLVMMIMAAIKSNQGEYYRYPLTLRLVS